MEIDDRQTERQIDNGSKNGECGIGDTQPVVLDVRGDYLGKLCTPQATNGQKKHNAASVTRKILMQSDYFVLPSCLQESYTNDAINLELVVGV